MPKGYFFFANEGVVAVLRDFMIPASIKNFLAHSLVLLASLVTLTIASTCF